MLKINLMHKHNIKNTIRGLHSEDSYVHMYRNTQVAYFKDKIAVVIQILRS